MPAKKEARGADLFIVDNSDKHWKTLQYLHDWADLAHTFDIATGYFDIGSLLALDGEWQKLDKIRVLMGDVVSRRTKKALLADVTDTAKKKLDESIESEKEPNDFLTGVPAIVDALQKRRIECRVYNKAKFHAKAYITHARQAVVGSSALVGSSNFTLPGLTENVELNIQLRREVETLQEWYEQYWDEAEDITDEILKVIERHTREYSPFEVYAKALQEFFRGHEMTAGEWENAKPEDGGSHVYPILDQYQKEGYQAVMKIARRHRGAFLCDSVGLGKTFIGLMLIERLVMFERKRVLLLAPKSARVSVWENELHRYLPHLYGDFSNLVVMNHTDLLRTGEFPGRFERMQEMADAIIIDEAHHFRNPGIKGEPGDRRSRYWQLYDVIRDKEVFLLTATPINNRLIDLQHMMELFSRHEPDYFKAAPLGIHSLIGHFRKMEKALETLVQEEEDLSLFPDIETNQAEAEKVLQDDDLFRALVVQRSRAYVKESQLQHDEGKAIFPERQDPNVVKYSLKKTYGSLLILIERAFSKSKPLFSLAMYYPLAYYKGLDDSIDSFAQGRQQQVVGLIRTLFLKRFESSARAFEMSCETLLIKLLVFATKHSVSPSEIKRLERWQAQHEDAIKRIQKHQLEEVGQEPEEEAEEDIIPVEMLEEVDELPREEYKVEEILVETFLDLDQVVEFLEEFSRIKSAHDDKLLSLIKLLNTDPVLRKHKVIIFTEYMATARYLKRELEYTGFTNVDEVDSATQRDRNDIINQFAPYYNRMTSEQLALIKPKEIRILISTDVLAEGLNLQDATRLINYDIHWNPVRLMQRIGRIDRRLNPEIEDQIINDHPDQKGIRKTVAFWNFLPPDELDNLLRLYKRVSHKTLRISKTFGIEGKKLLTPEDEYEALRHFNHAYEGTTTKIEDMHLEYQKLLKEYPEIEGQLKSMPNKIFSGKENPSSGVIALFFCFSLPAFDVDKAKGEYVEEEAEKWTEEAGYSKWYLYDLGKDQIIDEPSEIIDLIRSKPETPLKRTSAQETLSDIRKKIEKHIRDTYLKKVQAPIGVKSKLKAWMELS